MRDQVADTAVQVASVGSKTAATGVGITWLAWAASAEGASVIGLFIAIVGLFVQIHFRRKADRREAELHLAAMKRIAFETERTRLEVEKLNEAMVMTPRTDTGD